MVDSYSAQGICILINLSWFVYYLIIVLLYLRRLPGSIIESQLMGDDLHKFQLSYELVRAKVFDCTNDSKMLTFYGVVFCFCFMVRGAEATRKSLQTDPWKTIARMAKVLASVVKRILPRKLNKSVLVMTLRFD